MPLTVTVLPVSNILSVERGRSGSSGQDVAGYPVVRQGHAGRRRSVVNLIGRSGL
jgi:hypothetical protein